MNKMTALAIAVVALVALEAPRERRHCGADRTRRQLDGERRSS